MTAVLMHIALIPSDHIPVLASLDSLATGSSVLMSMNALLVATVVTQMPLAVIL